MIKKHLVNRKDIVIFQNPNLFDVLTALVYPLNTCFGKMDGDERVKEEIA